MRSLFLWTSVGKKSLIIVGRASRFPPINSNFRSSSVISSQKRFFSIPSSSEEDKGKNDESNQSASEAKGIVLEQIDEIKNEKITKEKDAVNDNLWAWIPPKLKNRSPEDTANGTVKSTYQLEIEKKVPLTMEEVKLYLEANGAQDVLLLKLSEPIVNITHFVLASCSSPRLIRQYALAIAKNLKQRELHWMLGSTGPEGAPDDDWQVVDCDEFAVQLLTPKARKTMDLESWWTMAKRPSLNWALKGEEFDRHFDELLEKYPPPSDDDNVNATFEPSDTTIDYDKEFLEVQKRHEDENRYQQGSPKSDFSQVSTSSSSTKLKKGKKARKGEGTNINVL